MQQETRKNILALVPDPEKADIVCLDKAKLEKGDLNKESQLASFFNSWHESVLRDIDMLDVLLK